MIVSIDGPAGAGKSTVARGLAQRLGFRYLDTGAMYRALTWLAHRDAVPLDKGPQLGELAAASPVDFDTEGRCFIAGIDVTAAIRRAEIDRLVPVVARHPEVRTVMRERQAEATVRASRRLAERPELSADALATDLRARDREDAVRMQPAEDAELIDTTDLSVEEVVDRIERLVRERAPA
jgi:cytidylate kinase